MSKLLEWRRPGRALALPALALAGILAFGLSTWLERGEAEPMPPAEVTGQDLINELGLDQHLVPTIPEGCRNSYWVADGLGLCLDGLAQDGIEMRTLVERLRGVQPSAQEVATWKLQIAIEDTPPGPDRDALAQQLLDLEASPEPSPAAHE